MANKRMIDCPGCGASLDIDNEDGDVLLLPREMLKYLEDSQGLIGIT
jgi:hypothetical protein